MVPSSLPSLSRWALLLVESGLKWPIESCIFQRGEEVGHTAINYFPFARLHAEQRKYLAEV